MSIFNFFKKKELQEIERLSNLLVKYQPIIDVELEKEKISQDIVGMKSGFAALDKDYQQSLAIYKKLVADVGLYESKLDFQEHGIYQPIYTFDGSFAFKHEQDLVIEKQKKMIKDGNATLSSIKWSVNGSEAKGRAKTGRFIKLILRAFNGECDALIHKVKWNNIVQFKERIAKSYETLNKIGENEGVSISKQYMELKLQELTLEHEHELRKYEEKVELRLAQTAIREEEQARKEYEIAQKEAEDEEKKYQKALSRLRIEFEVANSDKQMELKQQIMDLTTQLEEALIKKERAISMAQQTKRGHIYVVSNVGSFGENIFKIGMTRRLEPTDRIKELGDASVPFVFDTHAIIFSDDARDLERRLHLAFNHLRVNRINQRKEFFIVTLDEIESQVREFGLNANFIRIPEAMEYRETKALHDLSSSKSINTKDEFPDTLVN